MSSVEVYWDESYGLQVERRWTSYFGGASRSRGMELSLLLEDGLQFGKRENERAEEEHQESRMQRHFCKAWLPVPHSGFGVQWKFGMVARLGQICVL